MTRLPILLVACLVCLCGCETIPTHIDGRRVLGTRRVNGQKVYLVESREGDRIVTIQIAAESVDASRGMVFKGTATEP